MEKVLYALANVLQIVISLPKPAISLSRSPVMVVVAAVVAAVVVVAMSVSVVVAVIRKPRPSRLKLISKERK